ncbi:Trypsin [Dactylellina cionopaga]|nr:Trypsin [Dactylellina cionopaga]
MKWSIYQVLAIACLSGGARAIFGGSVASIGQIPYMAALESPGDAFCGAVIINAQYILTSYSCMEPRLSRLESLQVRTGSTKLIAGGQRYTIASVIPSPPRLDPSVQLPNPNAALETIDLALLRLSTPLVIDANTKAATLPPASQNVPDGASLQISGWGKTSAGSESSPSLLLVARTSVLNKLLCEANVVPKVLVDNHNICGAVAGGGKGICYKDAGGPVVYGSTLVGIATEIFGCGRVGRADVFINVSSYLDWIDSVVNA